MQALARLVASPVARSAVSNVARRRCSTMPLAGDKKLTDWEKRIMVWGGAFKSTGEVPLAVPHSQFQKCQERFRIKMNIYAMAITLGACGIMIYMGQRDQEAGMTLHNEVLKRHAMAAAAAAYEPKK